MGPGLSGIDGDSAGQELHSALRSIGLVAEHTEHAEGAEVARFRSDSLRIEGFGPVERALLVEGDGLRKRRVPRR